MPADDQYIMAFKQDDAKLLEAFYKQNWPRVLRFVLKNSGNEEDAKDIYQSAFISLYENIQKGKYTSSQKAKLSTYFFQICRNQWLNILKSAHHRYTKPINEEPTQSYVQHFNDTDPHGNQVVSKMVKKLNEKCQKILTMFYWHKYSLEEIAGKLNYTKESAKNAKYRCLKTLKSLLHEQGNV